MYVESSLDKVRDADIVTIVNHYTPLKRAGSLYECKSPFSEDNTPSFKVSPAKNNWVCYSSDQMGDNIKFVMIKESCSFVEAVKKIASICSIYLEEEQVSEAVLQVRSQKEEMFKLMNGVAKKYTNKLKQLGAKHWVSEKVAELQLTKETLLNFSIGFAPDDWKFITTDVLNAAKFTAAKSTGIITVKAEKSYDFFRNRLMFPIQDVNGNVIGFGGRCADDDPQKDSGRKYINSKESAIYAKSKTLYGIYQAKGAMTKKRTSFLVEGYTDVTALHQNGVPYSVASGGTALTDDQCKLLSRFSDHTIIGRDNDGFDANGNVKAGLKAALKDIDKLLKTGQKVSVVVFPEGEDPDSYSRKHENIEEFIKENTQDAVKWKTTFLFNQAANDPDAFSGMIKEVANMLFAIKDDIKRGQYIDVCRKIVKLPIKTLREEIDKIGAKVLANAESSAPDKTTSEDLGLPHGADFEEFKNFRYVTVGNACWFQGRSANFFKGTNFKLEPLFHVYGKDENKRLCEVVNEEGQKSLIDFDTADFVSRAKFEEALLFEGFFVCLENFGAVQFTLMRNRILSDFIKAYELKTLGWQREGFFAFANCIHHKGILKNVDSYGIVQLEELPSSSSSDYKTDIKHFYSPAFSEIYKNSRDDDDPYENDRHFIFKQSPVAFHTWMKQFKKVYDTKAITGIAFMFASMFRDIFMTRYAQFPHLFLTGEKGSGKSKFGESLVALFTYKQEAFDLNSGTPVAFTRRMSRFKNVPTMLEEYHDDVSNMIFQILKGAFDGRGREMGRATGDSRTKTTRVNSSLIILSQYLSSRDDNSLTSRSLIENFIKPQGARTQEQIEDYNLLKEWEEEGLSSMVIEIVQHRKYIEDNLHKNYAAITKDLKKELKDIEYEERMLLNYVTLLTPIKILWDKFQFPFTYKEMRSQFIESIIDSSDLIVESEGLSEFWRAMEYLLDRKPYALLTPGQHYKIDTPTEVKLQGRKNEKKKPWVNQQRDQIIFIRLGAVHQLYREYVSKLDGVQVITENTLRNYFKSKKYYLGSVKSERFTDTSTSGYVFNYTQMLKGGVLNLTREKRKDEVSDLSKATADAAELNAQVLEPVIPSSDDNDDLPF